MSISLGPYIALKRLLIPSGPGRIPSAVRMVPGDVFSFDGDEPVEIEQMLKLGAIAAYTKDLAKVVPLKGGKHGKASR